jgi:hypothetical protein
MMLSEHYWSSHHGLRDGFFVRPGIRPMGAGLDLHGRRKEAREAPVEIGLTQLAIEEVIFVLALLVVNTRSAAWSGVTEGPPVWRRAGCRRMDAVRSEPGLCAIPAETCRPAHAWLHSSYETKAESKETIEASLLRCFAP